MYQGAATAVAHHQRRRVIIPQAFLAPALESCSPITIDQAVTPAGAATTPTSEMPVTYSTTGQIEKGQPEMPCAEPAPDYARAPA